MQHSYKGSKGIVVIGIWVPAEVRAERMIARGDNPDAVYARIKYDKSAFSALHLMSDAWFRNVDLDVTVRAVFSYIVEMEG